MRSSFSHYKHRSGVYRKRFTLHLVLPLSLLVVLTTALVWMYRHVQNDIPSDGPSYGIAAGSSLPTLNKTALDNRLSGIAATGAKWIRFDFDWSQIQPNSAASYDWSTYDRLVREANHYKLHILGIIDYTPGWAQSSVCSNASGKCPPADPDQFAHFAGALARRYDSTIHYWEIWNEPNNPQFWAPAANPAEYVALLRKTYTALKDVDTHAYVITGGLSPQATSGTSYSPTAFLNAMYQDGAKGYFDAVGDHPYTFPLSPASPRDQAWNQMATGTNSLRATMVAQGDANKKIWITEFGAPTGGPGPVATLADPNLAAQPYVVDDALQNKILTDALQLYKGYPWVGPFFYYTYIDASTDTSTNENFFGLVSYNGTPKPAYYTFRQAATSSN